LVEAFPLRSQKDLNWKWIQFKVNGIQRHDIWKIERKSGNFHPHYRSKIMIILRMLSDPVSIEVSMYLSWGGFASGANASRKVKSMKHEGFFFSADL
jgi:hypothetical protein